MAGCLPVSEFKVGDRVRATEETARYYTHMPEDRDVKERRVLTIVHVDADGDAWPIRAMLRPQDYAENYWDDGVNLFVPEEIEHVED